jgi:hypothetical protein
MDPMHVFETDSGYQQRRSKHSRPRRRYTLDYLGKTTEEMRFIRDFLLGVRLGVLPFSFQHPTASDDVPFSNTTPVILTYTHGLITGQWLAIGNAPGALNGFWPVTRINHTQVALTGSVASGVGTGSLSAMVYLPFAVAVFDQDTWTSPTKLLGPERQALPNRWGGIFSWAVSIEEIF